jgi:hypothetical protein
MLSLPEDWDYTLAGLSQISWEKIDAIREAIWENPMQISYVLIREYITSVM